MMWLQRGQFQCPRFASISLHDTCYFLPFPVLSIFMKLYEVTTLPDLACFTWTFWQLPEDVTVFTSHFGVKFGIIICHEINFASPLRSMISQGVRDIIFPTQWGGAYGGNFAATQSGFAVVHQVNLLSANGMSGGSGIWPADPKRAPQQFLVTAAQLIKWL